MIHCGDCMSCQMLGVCSRTSYDKVWGGYTCEFFKGVAEPVYLARMEAMRKFGSVQAITAMLNRSKDVDEQP